MNLTSSSQDRYETRPTQFVNNHIISFDNTLFLNENTLKVGLAHSIIIYKSMINGLAQHMI